MLSKRDKKFIIEVATVIHGEITALASAFVPHNQVNKTQDRWNNAFSVNIVRAYKEAYGRKQKDDGSKRKVADGASFVSEQTAEG